MCKKIIVFCLLLVLVSGLYDLSEAQLSEGKFPQGHPRNYFESAASRRTGSPKVAKNSAVNFGNQITWDGIDKWETDWSPDGMLIAYTDDNNNVWIISTDGSNPKNLTENILGECYSPCFTPDSQDVMFTRYDESTDSYTLETVDPQWNQSVIMEDAYAGCWSNDGRYLAYRKNSTDELAVFDTATGQSKVIFEGDTGYGKSCFNLNGYWVITSKLMEDGTKKLFSVPREGGDAVQLTFGEGSHDYPNFSPTGEWMLYTDLNTLTLYAFSFKTYTSSEVFPDAGYINFSGHFSQEGDKFCYILDLYETASDTYSLEVFIADFPFGEQPAESLTLTYPNGGEVFNAGTDLEVMWESMDVATVDIFLSIDGGGTYIPIAQSYDASAGYLAWTIPADYESGNCLIHIVDSNNTATEDNSEGVFSITKATTEKYIEILSPTGGETWEVGTTQKITWIQPGVGAVDLVYSMDGGKTWTEIVYGLILRQLTGGSNTTTKQYNWEIPDTPSAQCLIKINDSETGSISDESDVFSIIKSTSEKYIEIYSPQGGKTLQSGTTFTISWGMEGVSEISIAYSIDGGATWNSIDTMGVGSIDWGEYSYDWMVPGEVSTNCLISVRDPNDIQTRDRSDVFSIISSTGAAYITLLSPMDGEVLEAGSIYTIQWESAGVNNVDIEVSWDGWATSSMIAEGLNATDGSYEWKPVGIESTECYVWVGDSNNDSVFSENEDPFTITSGGGQEPSLIFKFQTNDVIKLSSPAIGSDGTIYIGSTDFNLYAVNPDGYEKWRYELDGGIWASPVIGEDGTIYIGSVGGNFYAINPDGNLKWRKKSEDSIISSAAIGSDGTVYYGTGNGWFNAFNPDGTQRWGENIGSTIFSSPAIGIDGTIYFGDGNGVLHAYNPNGTKKWERNTNQGFIFSSPAISKFGTIYPLFPILNP